MQRFINPGDKRDHFIDSEILLLLLEGQLVSNPVDVVAHLLPAQFDEYTVLGGSEEEERVPPSMHTSQDKLQPQPQP